MERHPARDEVFCFQVQSSKAVTHLQVLSIQWYPIISSLYPIISNPSSHCLMFDSRWGFQVQMVRWNFPLRNTNFSPSLKAGRYFEEATCKSVFLLTFIYLHAVRSVSIIYKANTTSSAIWIWGPDSDKMTGTVVLRNGCRSTLWWTVFGRQEWWHLCFRRRKYWRWVIWSNRKVIAACDISAVQFEPTGNEWIALTAAKPSELCNVTVDCNVPRSCYLAQHVPRVPGIETRLNPTGTSWLQFQVLLVLLLKTYENRMCCPKNPIFHEFFQLPTGDWPKIPSDLLWLTLQRQRLHNAIPCSMSRLFCKVCLAQTYQLCNLNQLVMNELH